MQLTSLNKAFNGLSTTSFQMALGTANTPEEIPSENPSRLLAQQVLGFALDHWISEEQINELEVPVADGIISFNIDCNLKATIRSCAYGNSSKYDEALNGLMSSIVSTPTTP